MPRTSRITKRRARTSTGHYSSSDTDASAERRSRPRPPLAEPSTPAPPPVAPVATGVTGSGQRGPGGPRLRDMIPDEVWAGIEREPAFRVLSLDGLRWFCPYSGRNVAVGNSLHDAMVEHLARRRPWLDMEVLPSRHVRYFAWRYDCPRLVQRDVRMRQFVLDGRAWVNPFSGKIDDRVRAADNQISNATIQQMASSLANSPTVMISGMATSRCTGSVGR